MRSTEMPIAEKDEEPRREDQAGGWVWCTPAASLTSHHCLCALRTSAGFLARIGSGCGVVTKLYNMGWGKMEAGPARCKSDTRILPRTSETRKSLMCPGFLWKLSLQSCLHHRRWISYPLWAPAFPSVVADNNIPTSNGLFRGLKEVSMQSAQSGFCCTVGLT